MIRVRLMIERGLRNPWLRPFVLLFLCLLLGLVFVHAVHDGHDALTGVGEACVALAFFFGLVLIVHVVCAPAGATFLVRSTRAPPRRSIRLTSTQNIGVPESSPLRL